MPERHSAAYAGRVFKIIQKCTAGCLGLSLGRRKVTVNVPNSFSSSNSSRAVMHSKLYQGPHGLKVPGKITTIFRRVMLRFNRDRRKKALGNMADPASNVFEETCHPLSAHSLRSSCFLLMTKSFERVPRQTSKSAWHLSRLC